MLIPWNKTRWHQTVTRKQAVRCHLIIKINVKLQSHHTNNNNIIIFKNTVTSRNVVRAHIKLNLSKHNRAPFL